MDAALQAFEDARATRALRTDYEGHATTVNPKGAVIVDMASSTHRDRTEHVGTAAELARAYVDAHPELAVIYGDLSLEQLVWAVDAAREAGNEEKRITIDAWLMAKFPPQIISGAFG
jgi:hypothetical protein